MRFVPPRDCLEDKTGHFYNKMMKHLKRHLKIGGILVLFAGVGALFINAGPVSTNKVVDAENIYSPFLLEQGGSLRMYYGGWDRQGQVHDAIYRADCPEPQWTGRSWISGACRNPVKVIDAAENGFDALNDPTIVRMPGDYLIMYMTCVPGGQNGLTVTSNHICYSTSWFRDGLRWSRPTRLTNKAWLPSATIAANGRVLLFANSNQADPSVPFLGVMDLGTSGIATSTFRPVRVDSEAAYANVDVIYRPALGYFQIFGQNLAATSIDYLSSRDGVTWSTGRRSAVTPASGFRSVNTPAPHPRNSSFMYYGQTTRTDSMGYKIFFNQWF